LDFLILNLFGLVCFGFRYSDFGFTLVGFVSVRGASFDIRISDFVSLGRKRVVTKIFWVTCPQCKGEFYCHWQELRHKKIKLLCPYCSHQFLDEESPKIVE
jgi:DNA-directed RNA polymerase subunit RPC12/RpoP